MKQIVPSKLAKINMQMYNVSPASNIMALTRLEAESSHTVRSPLVVIEGNQRISDPKKVVDEITGDYLEVATEIFDHIAGQEMRRGALSAFAKDRIIKRFVSVVMGLDALNNTLSADQLAQVAGTNPEAISRLQERIIKNANRKSA